MEPIRVPGPSPTAFHKNRRISDLLLSQIRHFQHVAEKRSLKIHREIARDVHTEGGAARYIAVVTRALRKGAPSTAAKLVPMSGSKANPDNAGTVTSIAAAAKEPRSGRPKKRATARRSVAKKAKRVPAPADTAVSKKSKSRTAPRRKAGSKVSAKTKPKKRKKA
jgi:hypothetical protein